MKKFMTAVAVSATLFLAQSCSSSSQSKSIQVTTSDPHAETHQGHEMGGMEMPETTGSNRVKLTAPKTIVPKNSVPLVINIQDQNGKAIAKFERFQEVLMHLIVVSDDLQFFSHIHPTYKGNGQFDVNAIFPQPGSYTLFSDYKPSGQKEQVSLLKTQVSGNKPATPPIDLSHAKTFGNIKVSLTSSEPIIKAGQEVTLMFKLQQATNNQPVTDLGTYLGERAHLVILKQSSPLTRADYIHAHALKGTSADQIDVITQFPQPGKYKLWCQFNRNGKIVNADFWVSVL